MTLLTAKPSVKKKKLNADHELTLSLCVCGRIWWRRWWFFDALWSCHADRRRVGGKLCRHDWVSTLPCWQHRAVWPPPAPISVTPTMMWVCTPGSTYIAFKVMWGGYIFQEKNSLLCAVWWIVVFNAISIFTGFFLLIFFPSKLCIFFCYIFSEYTSKKLTVFTESRSESDFCMTGLQNYNIILTSVKGQEVSKS